MDGEDGERGVELLIGEGQVLRLCVQAWPRAGWSLRAHHGRGLHRDDVQVHRLIAPRTGDIDDAAHVAKRCLDLRGAPRVRSPRRRVVASQALVIAGHPT